ncbi:MAG TPA: dihydroorotate dehydrogenase-like protein [Phycisphaerae bacterium]|nr:dihydroorotate dehydrogenase-like protein [Phycisphaerae bacterium]
MNLSTEYMGMKLSSPLVPAASPLPKDLDSVRRMEDCGASAIVLWSLFEEQIEHEARELEHYYQYGAERFAESLSYFPQAAEFRLGPDEYLEHIARVKRAVDVPVIASLNGVSSAGWIDYATRIQQAGADALEVNVYYIPTDPDLPGEHVEKVYLSVLDTVKSSVSISVAMKLSPFFSSMGSMVRRLSEAGADGLVLFNRFYQPDIDVKELEVRPRLVLSDSDENRLPLRWIAILRGKVRASLAASTGIHTPEDVAKMVLAGADVTQVCSCLLKHGIEHLATLRKGLTQILETKGYDSLEQMKGVLSQQSCPEPAAFERGNYLRALSEFGKTATFE